MRETAVACGGSIESVRAFENAIAAVRRVRATSIVATASLATESTVVGEAAFSKQLLEHLQQARFRRLEVQEELRSERVRRIRAERALVQSGAALDETRVVSDTGSTLVSRQGEEPSKQELP